MLVPRTTPKVLAVLLAGSLSLASVLATAQTGDGTSGTAPEPTANCALAPATWQPAATTPVASPVASPVTSPEASPVASPVVEDAETDPLKDDLTTTADAILVCMSENNVEVLTQVTGPAFRGSWLGFGVDISDDDFAALLPMLPKLPHQLVSVDDATVSGETATATVTYTVGRQLHRSEWTFKLVTVDGTQAWQVQSENMQAAQAPAGAASMDLTIADGSFTLAAPSVPGGDIVINVSNTGQQPHEVLILKLPAGTGAAEIAAAPTGIPEGGTFIAQATVPAGTQGTIVLTDVRPGTYTVVDLLPDANGMPNVSSGMITTFEVTAP